MNKDKKIEIQNNIIHRLQQENTSLLERIKELEKQVNDNEKLVTAANAYKDEHEKQIVSLKEAKEKYLQAVKDMNEQKKKYKKDMESLIKMIKKNS